MEEENSEKEHKKIENIMKRFSLWLKDPYNLTFFLILLALIIYKLYWFFQTYSQPLWWDEADYMNMARTWLGFDYWDLKNDAVRPILLPAIASIFMFFGLGEISIRFFILLTSIASIILLYGIGNLFFNKKIALISSFILAIFWSFSFYSFRLLVDVPVAMLWLATIYFFFNAYFKEKSWKHFILPGIFLGLSFLMKYTSITLVFIFAFYLLTTERLKVLKNKRIYIFFLASLITILPLFIYQYSVYGNPMQFRSSVGGTGNPYSSGFSFTSLSDNLKSFMRQLPFIFNIIHPVFIILFLLGLLSVLFSIYSEKKIFIKESLTNKYYFIVLWILFSLIFFARLISSDTSYLDERYYFVFYPAIFLIAGKGVNFFYTFVKIYNKQLAFIAIGLLFLFSAYQHINHANKIIRTKKDSFIQLKLTGEYIKANTKPSDTTLILEETAEISYYAERKFVHMNYDNSSSIMGKIEKHRPKYAVMSFYYSLGNEFSYDIINYIFSHPEIFQPVQAYGPYVDKEQKIPLAIIFRVNPLAYY